MLGILKIKHLTRLAIQLILNVPGHRGTSNVLHYAFSTQVNIVKIALNFIVWFLILSFSLFLTLTSFFLERQWFVKVEVHKNILTSKKPKFIFMITINSIFDQRSQQIFNLKLYIYMCMYLSDKQPYVLQNHMCH